MDFKGKATRIKLLSFSTPQMRAFHMSWFAFFLCFFAWFGIVPMMPAIKAEMGLTKTQIGWLIIGSVSMTIFARLLIGVLCGKLGPRLTYTWLLILGALPVMGSGLATNFEGLLVARLLIGCIGAAFVITQYHTSVMFAPNCVGTANATSAGWGNLGGGVTQMVMPMIFGLFTAGVVIPFTQISLLPGLGLDAAVGWRLAMIVAGCTCMVTGVLYFFLTQDTPEGNFKKLRREGRMPAAKAKDKQGGFSVAIKDYRVWVLFLIYGGCFGIELTLNNVLASHLRTNFAYFQNMDATKAIQVAGAFASLFSLMNLFARTLGGFFGDKFGLKRGLKGRVQWLFIVLFLEGLALTLFSQMSVLYLAIPTLIIFSLFVQMSEGATYSVVPFINKRALGPIAGIVGAGGNCGAMTAGFLFKGSLEWSTALLILGGLVTLISFLAFFIRFSEQDELVVSEEIRGASSEAAGKLATSAAS